MLKIIKKSEMEKWVEKILSLLGEKRLKITVLDGYYQDTPLVETGQLNPNKIGGAVRVEEDDNGEWILIRCTMGFKKIYPGDIIDVRKKSIVIISSSGSHPVYIKYQII